MDLIGEFSNSFDGEFTNSLKYSIVEKNLIAKTEKEIRLCAPSRPLGQNRKLILQSR